MNSVRSVRQHTTLSQHVVAFSIGYDKADGGPRGFGPEHLREVLLQMARPMLRAGAAISYGGILKKFDPPVINFTLELLNLIREEQQENSTSDAAVSGLYNPQAWPDYLGISRAEEAEWINCCQIIRVTQKMAGIAVPIPDSQKEADKLATRAHNAICLSAMRRCMASGCSVEIDGTPACPRNIPPVSVRIVLGGNLKKFAGIMPGIFEEVLTTREEAPDAPIFILGGFGGAAGALAHVLLGGDAGSDPRLSTDFYSGLPLNPENPGFADLLNLWGKTEATKAAPSPERRFQDLRNLLGAHAGQPAAFLKNCLTDEENRRLLTTVDPTEAVRLVLRGLAGWRAEVRSEE